jgi:four helix bundle protein
MDFEQLVVWQYAKSLSVSLYLELADLRDFGFKDQITRAGLSVPSNIAEGMSRDSEKEKIRFLNIAKSSCSEVRTQIYIGIDIGFINAEVGQAWILETKRIASMLSGLANKIKQDLNENH